MARIITVAAAKGGVGKTTIAYELAAALNGVLVDLDWDQGNATRMWGFNATAFKRSPLLDALEAGPGSGVIPTIRRHARQPALVPGHPDLATMEVPGALVGECLQEWAEAWTEDYVVVDTHPGMDPLTDGAMSVSDVVVVPVVMKTKEMDALDGMLTEYRNHPLLLAPNMVRTRVAGRWIDRLERVAGSLPIAEPITEYGWIGTRLRRAAITLEPNPGANLRRAADEFRQLAARVAERAAMSMSSVEVRGTAAREVQHV